VLAQGLFVQVGAMAQNVKRVKGVNDFAWQNNARDAMLECQVGAALDGSDLGPFEPVRNEAGRGW
jgi:hypothetical protein